MNTSPLRACTIVVFGALVVWSLVVTPSHQATASTDAIAERGRYLVHNVAMCTDCHGAELHGGTIPGSAVRVPSLAKAAGLPLAAVETILQHGTLPPPMPHFGMTHDDAHAVAVYLATVR
jgi:mono/diheme cytochrome c family protein